MKKLLVALALGMFALPADALARPEYLGSVRLSRTGGTKGFYAPPCRQGERMDAIRLVVRNQPAAVQQVGVQFKNGQTQYFRVNTQFPANTRTRWIDLRGPRCIAAVQISGQSLNLVQKATVEVHGRVRQNNGGWPGGGNGGGGNGGGWPGDDDGYDDDGY